MNRGEGSAQPSRRARAAAPPPAPARRLTTSNPPQHAALPCRSALQSTPNVARGTTRPPAPPNARPSRSLARPEALAPPPPARFPPTVVPGSLRIPRAFQQLSSVRPCRPRDLLAAAFGAPVSTNTGPAQVDSEGPSSHADVAESGHSSEVGGGSGSTSGQAVRGEFGGNFARLRNQPDGAASAGTTVADWRRDHDHADEHELARSSDSGLDAIRDSRIEVQALQTLQSASHDSSQAFEFAPAPQHAPRRDKLPTPLFDNEFGGVSSSNATAFHNTSPRLVDDSLPAHHVAATPGTEQQPLASSTAFASPRVAPQDPNVAVTSEQTGDSSYHSTTKADSTAQVSPRTDVQQERDASPRPPSSSALLDPLHVRIDTERATATTLQSSGASPPTAQLAADPAVEEQPRNSTSSSAPLGTDSKSSKHGQGASEIEDVTMADVTQPQNTSTEPSASTSTPAASTSAARSSLSAFGSGANAPAQAAQPSPAPAAASTSAAVAAPPARPVINVGQRLRELARAERQAKASTGSLLQSQASTTSASAHPAQHQPVLGGGSTVTTTASRPSSSTSSITLPNFQRIGSSASRPQQSASRTTVSPGAGQVSSTASNSGQGNPAPATAGATSADSSTSAATAAGGAGEAAAAATTGRPKKPKEFLVLFRSSKAPERFVVRDGNIPKNHPNRKQVVDSLKLAAQINVQAALDAYARDGKDGADAIFYLDGSEIFTPFIAFGHATGPPLSWSLQGTELPSESSGKAFLRRLPTARMVVVIGMEGVTVDVEILKDTFALKMRDDCEIVVTRGAGSGEPLNMTALELKRGLDRYLEGKSMKNVHPDVKTWIEGLKVGMERRTGVSLAQSKHGGEFRRSGHDTVNGGAGRRSSKKRARDEDKDDDNDDDDDEEQELAPPLDWVKHWRCGRNGCLYVGLWQDIIKHRKGSSRVKCYGKCPLDCVLNDGGAAGMRAHLLTEHKGERRVCKFEGCIGTSNAANSTSNILRHEERHGTGAVRPDGMDARNRWVTLERASTRPIYPELNSSPWIDRSTAKSRTALAFDPFADDDTDETDVDA